MEWGWRVSGLQTPLSLPMHSPAALQILKIALAWEPASLWRQLFAGCQEVTGATRLAARGPDATCLTLRTLTHGFASYFFSGKEKQKRKLELW